MEYLLLFPILFPVICGFLMFTINFKSRKVREWSIVTILCINTVIVWLLAFLKPGVLTLASFAKNLEFSLFLDGPGTVFSCMVAILWIPATIYAFDYMEHEKHHLKKDDNWVKTFFIFYIMTYGVTVGLAYAANPLTMYVFFEALTLVTLPLVIHLQDEKSIAAGRKYLKYMLGGAAFGFIALVLMVMCQNTAVFTYGGIMDLSLQAKDVLLFAYVCGFCGFGIKTALFPFGKWLIAASAAATPVTALLHAVAVVKAGAFVVIRLTYYCFGTEFLAGSWAQAVVTVLVCMTICYASTMSVRETHLKRRMAYSTMSNLSYILLAAVAMNPIGLTAAFTHMVFHAFMKIDGFFCVGTIMQKEEKNYVDEINGIGKKLPVLMICYTIVAFALTGIPPFAGFISKWKISEALVSNSNKYLWVCVFVLLYSALCTAVYMFTIVIRAWLPPKGTENTFTSEKPGPKMILPLVFFSVTVIVFGLYSSPLLEWLKTFIVGVAGV